MKRKIVNKNKLKNMTKQDWIETNEMSKNSRGLSSLSLDDIFGLHGFENIEEIRKRLQESNDE